MASSRIYCSFCILVLNKNKGHRASDLWCNVNFQISKDVGRKLTLHGRTLQEDGLKSAKPEEVKSVS